MFIFYSRKGDRAKNMGLRLETKCFEQVLGCEACQVERKTYTRATEEANGTHYSPENCVEQGGLLGGRQPLTAFIGSLQGFNIMIATAHFVTIGAQDQLHYSTTSNLTLQKGCKQHFSQTAHDLPYLPMSNPIHLI